MVPNTKRNDDSSLCPDGFISTQNAAVSAAKSLVEKKTKEEIMPVFNVIALALASNDPAITRDEAVLVHEHVYACYLSVHGPTIETKGEEILRRLEDLFPDLVL